MSISLNPLDHYYRMSVDPHGRHRHPPQYLKFIGYLLAGAAFIAFCVGMGAWGFMLGLGIVHAHILPLIHPAGFWVCYQLVLGLSLPGMLLKGMLYAVKAVIR